MLSRPNQFDAALDAEPTLKTTQSVKLMQQTCHVSKRRALPSHSHRVLVIEDNPDGRYAEARGAAVARELEALRGAAAFAREQGLHVHMGHGLNYANVGAVARLPGVEELNIGHSIVSRAVLVGMERAVREMKEAIRLEK